METVYYYVSANGWRSPLFKTPTLAVQWAADNDIPEDSVLKGEQVVTMQGPIKEESLSVVWYS